MAPPTYLVELLQLLTEGLEGEARAAFVSPGQETGEEKGKAG